ncbi:MAG: ATP synthase F1 subunit epsilon [Rhodobiaceae bacterium]|jgi:F-type H+-transporting ATPase subunit epsilon|nr:ATP synthase F1 subunit epsilon [Alphaproteobacteria bacterium]
MAAKLKFDLVSPERLVLSAEVDAVQIPGAEGDFGVLPNHSPVMSVIREGVLRVENDGTVTEYQLDGGFADVTPEGVTVLAETITGSDA